jgi:hypothetical protein
MSEWIVRRPTLHEIALIEAERANPGGEHRITSVEIDGEPGEPGDAKITVFTRVVPDVQMVDIAIRPADA